MLKVYLEKFEDFSDKLLRVLKPYARGLAQVIQDFRLCRIGNRDARPILKGHLIGLGLQNPLYRYNQVTMVMIGYGCGTLKNGTLNVI